MFISTVVHLFEFILLSLLGIMLYKLFASYKKWKNMSVSSSSKGGDRTGRVVKPALPQNPDYLSISKITVTEEQSASQPPVKEKQSSVILTDYIGEFFAETKPMNLEPFRAKQPERSSLREVESTSAQVSSQAGVFSGSVHVALSAEKLAPIEPLNAVSPELVDDEIIQVKPLNLSPVILTHAPQASNAESDAYITVASGSNELSANNIMSDKVVMAMLDEAKLVCAS